MNFSRYDEQHCSGVPEQNIAIAVSFRAALVFDFILSRSTS